MALSQRQKRIIEAIKESLAKRGYPPTVRELCQSAGISSTSVVGYNLKRLEEKGYLRRIPEVSRGMTLPDWRRGQPGEQVRQVPLLGRIAAGAPLRLPDTPDAASAEALTLAAGLLPDDSELYALEVRGLSMVDALIGDGDIVVIRRQDTADNGAMVVAWLKEEGETTLKLFFAEGERVRLQPANPYMQPLYFPSEDVEIQGKVVLVLRRPDGPIR